MCKAQPSEDCRPSEDCHAVQESHAALVLRMKVTLAI